MMLSKKQLDDAAQKALDLSVKYDAAADKVLALTKQHDELRRAALQVAWQIKTQHMATNKTDAANKLARAVSRLEYIAR